MSDITGNDVDLFRVLIDEMLNAVLFVLTGLAVLLVTFRASTLAAMLSILKQWLTACAQRSTAVSRVISS